MRLPLEPGLFICVLSVCIKLFKLILKEHLFYFDKMEPKFCADSLRCVNLMFQKSFCTCCVSVSLWVGLLCY